MPSHPSKKPLFRPAPLAAAAVTLLGLMAGAPAVQAQAVPDSGQLLQQIPALRPAASAAAPRIQVAPVAPAAAPATGPALLLQAVDFDGDAAVLDGAALQALVRPAIGQRLGLEGLQALADQVAAQLRIQGFALAQVLVPAQEVRDGRVRFTVRLGRLDRGAADGGLQVGGQPARLRLDLVRRTVEAALADAGDVLRLDALERGVLLVNELPGVSAAASLERGSAPGTTRVALQVSEGPLLASRGVVDNAGNRYTGTTRLTAALSLLDPTGQGDAAQLQASAAERTQALALGYQRPVGAQGWRVGASATTLRYRLGEELAALDARGTAHGLGLSVSQATVRTRSTSVTTSINLDHRRLGDDSLGQALARKRSNALTLGVSGSRSDEAFGGGLTQGSLGLTVGRLDLSRVDAALAADQAGPRVHGRFVKLNYGVARLQQLGGATALYLGLRGQAADGNLDSSEKLQLGGAGGVRAYPSGEGSVDEGALLNAELRHDLALRSLPGPLQLVAFVDAATARQHRSPWAGWAAGVPGQANTIGLAGAGVGVNLQRGPLALRGAWARKLGSNPLASAAGNDADGRRHRSRVWLQASIDL